ncbi:modification methylase [Thermogladius calderae 1633]|uniref:Type II methyltransferase n=1 Tax=Thermogladius calderae (strain DSM 22663 / VKM B-2946 / 1633) TaxID=1184251 RepID=I3TEC2_THEC1|nr:site-specific DNA-methyltransferase [Thermogladius calderae]AFK51110.1 modification methylase [Thermogladius calderae 1633]
MVFVKVVFGDARNMGELQDGSVHLVVTSPPYYNAPFDFPGLFPSYGDYLDLLRGVGREIYRVLAPGRVACFVTQDVRVEGRLYPIVSDLIHIMVYEVGFEYQEKIVWRKPEGYIRISRRSGVLIQHPYPMYYYPDNIYEEIVVFRKPGEFDRTKVPEHVRERSRIDVRRFQVEKWYLSVWDIKNVLPSEKWSKYTAAFPEELVQRLVRLYSYVGETVLDPFLGTGTTCAVARRLERNCVGYEIDLELREVIEERLGIGKPSLTEYTRGADVKEVVVRNDARRLRTTLRERIERRLNEKNERSMRDNHS